MLNKKTILFFTDTNRTAAAEAVACEFPQDGSVISVVIEKKELQNSVVNKILDKVISEESKLRLFLRDKGEELTAMRRDGKKKEQKTKVFDNKNFFQRRILNVLNRYTPDVVCVTSHKVIGDVLATVQHYGQGVKVAVLCEDYVLDSRLVNRVAEKYFVDNFAMRNELVSEGIAPEKIEVAEIPVKADFFVKGDRAEARKKLVLDQKDTVLVSADGYGDERAMKVVKALKDSDLDVNVAVACGKNTAFLNAVREAGAYAFNESLDVSEALDASDVLVTRPNNILIAQARTKGLKIYAVAPANRTEEENLKYLALETVERVEDEVDLVKKVGEYLSEPAETRVGQTEEVEKFSAHFIANALAEMAKRNVVPKVEEEKKEKFPEIEKETVSENASENDYSDINILR